MGERDWRRAKAIMASEPTTAGHLYEGLGHLVATWNAAEKGTRQILEFMIQKPVIAELTVARLDAYAVEDTIRAAADFPEFADIRDCLKEFCENFGKLREIGRAHV